MPLLNSLLILLVLICTAADLQKGIIPNAVVAAGMAGVLTLRVLLEGACVLVTALSSAAVILIVLFPLWYLTGGKGIGAGDIKLLAVVSMFFPAEIMLMVSAVAFSGAALCGLAGRWAAAKRTAAREAPLSGRVHMAFFIALGALLHIGGLY